MREVWDLNHTTVVPGLAMTHDIPNMYDILYASIWCPTQMYNILYKCRIDWLLLLCVIQIYWTHGQQETVGIKQTNIEPSQNSTTIPYRTPRVILGNLPYVSRSHHPPQGREGGHVNLEGCSTLTHQHFSSNCLPYFFIYMEASNATKLSSMPVVAESLESAQISELLNCMPPFYQMSFHGQ